VLCLLIVGAPNVFPQYLWWGPVDAPLIAAFAVILLGGSWVLRGIQMRVMVLSFLLPFIVLIGAIAATGGCFSAVWHAGPVCGVSYWTAICTSPALLIFVLFMMSDPKTAPSSSVGRALCGVSAALVAAVLVFFQPTEFGIKVGILASLTVACSMAPFLDWRGARSRRAMGGQDGSRLERFASALGSPAVIAAVIVATSVPTAVIGLATNPHVSGAEGSATSAKANVQQ
jgi:hypothetical protein